MTVIRWWSVCCDTVIQYIHYKCRYVIKAILQSRATLEHGIVVKNVVIIGVSVFYTQVCTRAEVYMTNSRLLSLGLLHKPRLLSLSFTDKQLRHPAPRSKMIIGYLQFVYLCA